MAIYPAAQSSNRSLPKKDSMFHASRPPRPDPSSCVPREWSQPSPVTAPSHFIPVYTVDDDELAASLERVNKEVSPGLIPLPILQESHSPSILGSKPQTQYSISAAIPQCQIEQPTKVVHHHAHSSRLPTTPNPVTPSHPTPPPRHRPAPLPNPDSTAVITTTSQLILSADSF